MDQKINIRSADILMQGLVCKNLHKEINDFNEMFLATEEWLLFLTAAPSNSLSRNCFPVTPSDLSRTRKRVDISTIAESAEEDEAMPLPQSKPADSLRRGSRTASKLASLKMKEPNLVRKLRRPGNSIQEEDTPTTNVTEVPPPKRARKGKSNMPKANMTFVTPESSFVSARDSLTSDQCNSVKIEPVDTEDDIILENYQSTKISTFDNCTKKSSMNVKTVTVMRSSKRVTKQLIKTVIESPAKCMTTRISATKQNTDSPATDNDDNIPIINFVTKTTSIVQGKKNIDEHPTRLSNAANHKTSEAIKDVVEQNLMPVSVIKSIEDIKQEPVEPVVPPKPKEPVRMTRTKVRAMMASLIAENSLPEKTTRKIETTQLLKIAQTSLLPKKVAVAKGCPEVDVAKTIAQENTSPPPNRTIPCLSQSVRSTNNKNRTTPNPYVDPSRLLAQMSVSKQPLINFNTNTSTFLPKAKIVSAAEKAEEKRKEERRQRRENNDDALLKKKALIDDKTEQRRKKREEKERNVLAQKALKEREMAEMKLRIEKEQEEKARLVEEREENLKREILRKKEEAKLKAAKIEERRVRQEAERLQALKLQEEEQQKLLVQKKKEQEDAERLHAKRMLEEKERKEKEAALKEAALKLEKQNQMKKVVPSKTLDATFNVEKPVLIAASKYDYPLLDLSKGNDSDFSEGEEEDIPSWAKHEALVKNLKSCSGIPIKALLCYFDSKPTTPDLNKIFLNGKNKHVRSSSAFWKTPPRSSMAPII